MSWRSWSDSARTSASSLTDNWSSRRAWTKFARAARSRAGFWKRSGAIRPPPKNWSGWKEPRRELAALSRADLAARSALPQPDASSRQAQRGLHADPEGAGTDRVGRPFFYGPGTGGVAVAQGACRPLARGHALSLDGRDGLVSVLLDDGRDDRASALGGLIDRKAVPFSHLAQQRVSDY